MQAGVRLLDSDDGRRFDFDPGSFCLELLLTGGPVQVHRTELLRGPGDIVEWVVQSRLARVAALDDVRVRPSELRELKDFRDVMWSVARGVARGDTVDREHLAHINDCASMDLNPELDPDTGARRWAAPITGDQILGAAARDAIELIGERASRVRECVADGCVLVFCDTSRPGNRRWCSMRRCGNRSKVKAYRNRQD
ncbi:CGNR zinc finger domain-containing protein [Haloechinothrix salitolerans]|uniref:CGNR zinc finger domain-containing protein n=1 Tax=Haloechinothrix salitolerans TaxID=926830 RepID=A0ABW2BT27_9PSEU